MLVNPIILLPSYFELVEYLMFWISIKFSNFLFVLNILQNIFMKLLMVEDTDVVFT